MKNGGPNHPKTIHLADILGLERWGAVGIIETLLHWCRQYAIQGNVGKWSDKAIADGIGWRGDPDKLICALVLAQYLDRNDDPLIRITIHDIEKHADNTWKQNLEDAGLKWWNGKKARNDKVGRPKGVKRTEKNSRKTPDKLQNLELKTPQPEPKPEPKPVETEGAASPALPPQPVLKMPEVLNNANFRAAWSDWIAQRKALKIKSYTPQGAQAQLDRIAMWGSDGAIAAIRHSIAQNSQGIYPEHGNGKNNQPGSIRYAGTAGEFD